MLITISGTPGAGKGTTAALLSRQLGIPAYSIGDIRRHLARSRGLTLEAFNRYGETHPSADLSVDRWQKAMAKKSGRGIFEGRVSFYFIPDSVKIYLACSRREGARRIMNDPHWKRKHEADLSTLSRTEAAIARRVVSDVRRYKKYYGVNIHDRSQYDLMLVTTRLKPRQVVQKITRFLKKYGYSAKISQKVKKKGKS